MKNLITLYKSVLLAVATFALASCSIDDVNNEANETNNKQGCIVISTRIIPPIGEDDAESRTIDAANENVISNLHILAFNSAGEMVTNGYIDYLTGSQHTFTMNLGVERNGQHVTLYGIANIGNANIFDDHKLTLTEIKEFYVRASDATDLMNGVYTIYTENDEVFCKVENEIAPILVSEEKKVTVNKDADTHVTLDMERQCAKIILNIYATGINIDNYQLCHIPTTSNMTPIGTSLSAREYTDMPKAMVAEGDILTGITYYVYENYNEPIKNITLPTQRSYKHAPKDATYINVHGTYSSGVVLSSTFRVYPGGVNSIGEQDLTQFSLERNHNYICNVNINGVVRGDDRVINVYAE